MIQKGLKYMYPKVDLSYHTLFLLLTKTPQASRKISTHDYFQDIKNFYPKYFIQGIKLSIIGLPS